MDLASIARSTTLRGLIKAAADIPGCLPWALLYPLTSPVFHDAAGLHPVDSRISGEIAELPFARSDSVTRGVTSPWLAKLKDLLAYQSGDLAATKAAMLIWANGELVAVIGVGTRKHSVADEWSIASEAANAFRRVHEHERLRQELSANKHLNLDHSESILIVHGDGRIMLGTETGKDALCRYMHHRPTKKNPIKALPNAMLEALPKSGKLILGKLAITVYQLPGEFEILSPLRVVFLETVQTSAVLGFAERIETLTPSQRAAYHFVIGGLRNKQIAAELGISYNSAIHLVARMLSQMACGDRLQLMATAAQVMPRKAFVPQLTAAPVMPNLLRSVRKAARVNV